ncbi:SF0329 family protein [Paenibacillus glufosinatiresistens]|uniref:SF0329 family protein n=1 Tax=Paenibacillus glufosinatiresistens TaxID=3070657 RepID=UPI00286E9656|nr:hypothetical protein [Paenibacillus sp. YX.27]
MSWSKLKQQLESFLAPALSGRVEYRAPGYRYLPDKSGICYLSVDKKNILLMNDRNSGIRWYESELEIKNDLSAIMPVRAEEVEAVRQSSQGTIPEDRLIVMARGRKSSEQAKAIWSAQVALSKSDFIKEAHKFLTTSIEESLESTEILSNILALLDRRVGKKRLMNLSEPMKLKHPGVQYFYELRRATI